MIDKQTPIELLESMNVPLDNPYFVILHNVEDKTYDLILKEEGYAVTEAFLDVLGLIHIIGQKCVEELRIGHKVVEKKKIIVNKPKLIIN